MDLAKKCKFGKSKIYPRSVRQMFTRKSAPQPASRRTPIGGTGFEAYVRFADSKRVIPGVFLHRRVMRISKRAGIGSDMLS